VHSLVADSSHKDTADNPLTLKAPSSESRRGNTSGAASFGGATERTAKISSSHRSVHFENATAVTTQNSEVEKLRHELAALKEKHASEIQSWQHEKNAYDSQVVALNEQVEIMSELVASEKNASKEEKQELEKKLSMKLIAVKKSMVDETKTIQERCKQLTKSVEKLKKEMMAQKLKAIGNNTKLSKEIKVLTEKNVALEQSAAKHQTELKKEKKLLVVAKKEHYAVKRSLTEKIDVLKNENESLKQEIRELTKSITDMKAFARKEKNIKAVAKQSVTSPDVKSLRDEISVLEKKVTTLTMQKDTLTDSYVQLSNSSIMERRELDKSREQVKTEATKRQTAEAQLLLLRTELQIVKKMPSEKSNARRVSVRNDVAGHHTADATHDTSPVEDCLPQDDSSELDTSLNSAAGLSAHFSAPPHHHSLKEECNYDI
jgi:hypothetical protein